MVRTALIILALWPTLAGAAGVNLKAVTVSQLADVVFRAYSAVITSSSLMSSPWKSA